MTFNPATFSSARGPRSNKWLFDTGSTVYICNNKALFTDLDQPGFLYPVRTGRGPVRPTGIGTIAVEFLTGHHNDKPVFTPLNLVKTLYIPDFPLNIISSYRLYASGGTLIRQKVYGANRKLVGLLDFQQNGFFFTHKTSKTSYY